MRLTPLQHLYQFTTSVTRAEALADLYEEALQAVMGSFKADRAAIALFDDHAIMRFVAWRGLSEGHRRAVEGHFPWKSDAGRPSPLVGQVDDAPIERPLRETLLTEGIQGLAFVPVTYGGRLMGSCMVYFDRPYVLSEQDMGLAQSLADIMAVGIEKNRTEEAFRANEKRLRSAIDAGKVGTWDWDLALNQVSWSEQVNECFGLSPGVCRGTGEAFTAFIHPDDRPKVLTNIAQALKSPRLYRDEMRIVRPDTDIRWISISGRVTNGSDGRPDRMMGALIDITETRSFEERLAKKSRSLQVINQVGKALAAELDFPKLIQAITDAGREVSGAEFGAFFYNEQNDHGESYQLFTLSGVPRESFEGFGMPRNTPLFGPTFRGDGPIRIGDVLSDSRYGTMAPHHGMPKGHLPVRSYLALPVIAHSGKVFGGLFFGHSKPDVFTEQAEQTLVGIAGQASIALDNASLYESLRKELMEHKRTAEALCVQEQQLRLITDTVPVYIAHCDPAGRYKFVNKAYAERFGLSAEACVGKKISDVVGVDAFATFRAYVDIALSGQTVEFDSHIPYQGIGSRWMHCAYVPEVRGDGTVCGFVAVISDITERKEAEHALRGSEERLRLLASQLEDLVEERTQELVQSQHRLRALATELNLAEQRERKRVATELHDHLQQLLVLGKLKLGQGKRLAEGLPACAEVMKNVDEVLTEALSYTRTLVAELCPPVLREFGLPAALKWLGEQMHHHQLIVSVEVVDDAAGLSEEHGVLLFQSVRELLINSAKHAGTGQATVRLERDTREVRIIVSDQGAGFDLTAVEPQATTPWSSKFGLFSIRERMRALGGRFELHSAPGAGTRSTLILPLAECPERQEVHASVLKGKSPLLAMRPDPAATNEPSERLSSEVIRVLLVDDHAMMRQGLRSVLEAYADVQIVGEAGDGEEAIALVELLRPSIVVMDINMSQITGIDATARIKAHYPATKIIGLSVNAGKENQEAMTKAGAESLLTKEAAVDELYRAIQKTLNRRTDGSGKSETVVATHP